MKCQICGDNKKFYSIKSKDFDKSIKEELKNQNISWFLCATCGNGFQVPESEPELLTKYWNSIDTGSNQEVNIVRINSAKRVYKYFSKFDFIKNKTSMLDIGCGDGYLLKEFQDNGFNVLGIDIDEKTKSKHIKLGVDSIIGRTEEVELKDKYNIAFTTNSIYFVQKPVDFLKKISTFINEDGYLCVVMADFLTFRDDHLPSYIHSFYPSYESIDYLLYLAGFELIQKEKKASNILIIAKKSNEFTKIPKVNLQKIRFLLKTKMIRYFIFGKAYAKLYHLLKNIKFIKTMYRKLIRF